jgi:hypothetical protein
VGLGAWGLPCLGFDDPDSVTGVKISIIEPRFHHTTMLVDNATTKERPGEHVELVCVCVASGELGSKCAAKPHKAVISLKVLQRRLGQPQNRAGEERKDAGLEVGVNIMQVKVAVMKSTT